MWVFCWFFGVLPGCLNPTVNHKPPLWKMCYPLPPIGIAFKTHVYVAAYTSGSTALVVSNLLVTVRHCFVIVYHTVLKIRVFLVCVLLGVNDQLIYKFWMKSIVWMKPAHYAAVVLCWALSQLNSCSNLTFCFCLSFLFLVLWLSSASWCFLSLPRRDFCAVLPVICHVLSSGSSWFLLPHVFVPMMLAFCSLTVVVISAT